MSAPGITPSTPEFKPPASTAEAAAKGYTEISSGVQLATTGPNAGFNVRTTVMQLDRYSPYQSATVVYQEVATTKRASSMQFQPASIVERAGNYKTGAQVTHLPTGPNAMAMINADPALKGAYDEITKTLLEGMLQRYVMKAGKEAKKFAKKSEI